MPHDKIRWPKESLRKAHPKGEIPHLFGRGLRDRTLVCLAANGPMHVRHLARTLDAPPSKVFRVVEDLIAMKLVVKRRREGGRRYVALNRGLPIYAVLERLLLVLDRVSPMPRVRDRRHSAWYMPFSTAMSTRLLEGIFGSRVGTRVLVFAVSAGESDLASISAALKIHPTSAVETVKRWEREGVLRSSFKGGARQVALNPAFCAARQLQELIAALVQLNPEYQSSWYASAVPGCDPNVT